MSDAPAITALAPWYGAKRRLAPAIIEALGPHRAYWEPFCGSMAVLLAKPPASMETVNDLHGDLINLARVIVDDQLGPALYRRLRRTLMHEDLFAESVARLRAEWRPGPDGASDVDRAYWFFVHSWMGCGGLAGIAAYNHSTPAVRYSQRGGHSATRWESAVRSIPQWRERLRGVTILRRDAFDILTRIDDADGCAIYVDPPYLARSHRYQHDFVAEDHVRLAATLRRFTRTSVVVSYYDHPRLAELYPPDHWHYRRIEMHKAMSNTGVRSGEGSPKSTAVELLLCNQDAWPAWRKPAARAAERSLFET